MRVLIPPQPIDPARTHLLTLKHHVNLLTVKPALRVHVPVPLDTDLLIHNHDFDVTISLLELGYDGRSLVLADVEEVMEVFLGGLGEGGVPE